MRLYLSSFGLGDAPEHFVRLLGVGRRIGVILNAVDLKTPERRGLSLAQEFAALRGLGMEPEEIDLRDHFGSSPERMRSKLSNFDGLWFRGGNTFVLRRALAASGADAAIVDLLREDRLVYGGFSAAIAVLGPTLQGVELVDGSDEVPPHYDPEPIWTALGLLPYAVAPHYRSDHPESEAVDRLVAHYIDVHVPFVALRDGEAIVRDGDEERVVGVRPR